MSQKGRWNIKKIKYMYKLWGGSIATRWGHLYQSKFRTLNLVKG